MSGSQPAFRRVPLLALGGVALVAGIWGGLSRLGWALPVPSAVMVSDHGALMICGFLGTLIGVERAVALGRGWAYAAPVLTGLGSVAIVAHAPSAIAIATVVLGSVVFLAASTMFVVRQPAGFTATMAAGALFWVVGNLLWLMGRSIGELVPWWVGFVLLTIAGERLQLSRLVSRSRWTTYTFFAAGILFGLGVMATTWWQDVGTRVVGAALVALSLWLCYHDIARRTVRHSGLTRFVAVCLLSGYGWLAVSGGLLLAFGALAPGSAQYDAALHAFFVGFVFSMIFGHAPIIFPAILRITLRYRPLLYLPLTLLHASLFMRMMGDLGGISGMRLWGGALNGLAIVLFIGTLACSAVDPATLARSRDSEPNGNKERPAHSARGKLG